MRKLTFLLILSVTTLLGTAQTVMYSQSFEDTTRLFSGYVLRNYDFGVPALSGWDTLAKVPWFVTKAGAAGNHAAVGTSGYSPAKAADDWMITPSIRLGAASKLSWKSLSLTSGTTDTYQVYISTTEPSPAGCLFNGIAGNFTSAQSVAFQSNTIDLASLGYDSEYVYVGFRLNTQNGGGVMAIDDITVTEEVTPFVSLTFNVNMRNYIASGSFNPAKHTVDVAGTFNGWDGTRNLLSMLPGTDSSLYSVTVPGFLDGDQLQFKFRINSTFHDSIVEFPYGAPNRIWTIEQDKYSYTCFYNDRQNNVYGIGDPGLAGSVSIYPNPAHGIVALELPEAINRVMLSTMQGRQMLNLPNKNNKRLLVDVSSYPPGIYLLTFYSGNKLAGSRKLIRK